MANLYEILEEAQNGEAMAEIGRAYGLTQEQTDAPAFTCFVHRIAGFIASMPERRVRIAFMNSNTLLWLTGAWIYIAVPALGHAYRFPEVWLPLAPYLANIHNISNALS